MEVAVAFTPSEVVDAPVAIMIDVIRATSTIAAALRAGFERVASLGSAAEIFARSRSAARLRAVGLDADVEWCARENVVGVAPVVVARIRRPLHWPPNRGRSSAG